ncbi:tyrosine-protein kinase receptor Tie-1 [Elysia marginata]|uniref:Tyrosine-protein kinase receptor Tie-1 n=1 Tax=Elysia marginata TaxID=1093978 RepID=A0AAV4G0J7_9GAST|nr:tyrosine-protein kinase receptor Tie-1 [Elysia marginata]
MCFLCHEEGGRLHQVQTLELDRRLRDCVQDLQDQQLIAELNTASDLVAREAKYHAKCLTALYNRHRDSEKARASDTSMSSSSLALAELIAFMEESHVENRSTVFRLADLSKLYEARVNQLRGQFPLQARAHSTHLKKRLLQNVPGLVAFNEGREVYLSYDEVACTLKRQYNEEKDTESITMARLANSIRNDMFATSVSFTGQFDHETQIQSVPQRLLVLVNMIINGPNIKDQAEQSNITQPVLTVAQLLMGNAYKQRRKPKEPSTQIFICKEQTDATVHLRRDESAFIDS